MGGFGKLVSDGLNGALRMLLGFPPYQQQTQTQHWPDETVIDEAPNSHRLWRVADDLSERNPED